MEFFGWLELSSLGDWVATSTWGYPILLSCHAIGLAVVAGSLTIVDLRVLGCFPGLEIAPLRCLIKLAWVGFIVNLISGFSLFAGQATYFITHPAFLIKITCILLALVGTARLQGLFKRHADDWDAGGAVGSNAKILALSSLLLLCAAMIAGRLIAYIE
ncbi:MAG: hypothetical protein ACJAUG_003440 [Halioglobus sp.]